MKAKRPPPEVMVEAILAESRAYLDPKVPAGASAAALERLEMLCDLLAKMVVPALAVPAIEESFLRGLTDLESEDLRGRLEKVVEELRSAEPEPDRDVLTLEERSALIEAARELPEDGLGL